MNTISIATTEKAIVELWDQDPENREDIEDTLAETVFIENETQDFTYDEGRYLVIKADIDE